MEQIELFSENEQSPKVETNPVFNKDVMPDASAFFDSGNVIDISWDEKRGQWVAMYRADDPSDMYRR